MTRHPCPTLRVHVAHAYPLVTSGLAHVLAQVPHVELVAGDALPPPDVVVCDYHAGLARAARAREAGTLRRPAGARVVVVTERCREQDVRLALEAGVAGYLQQGCTSGQVADCIRQVAAGMRYLESDLAVRMADSLCHEALTGRECEVLAQVALGLGNKAIALQLGISVGTVKAHLKAIMAKLRAASRTEAASIALKRGLVDDVPPMRAAAGAWQRARPSGGVALAAG